MSLSLCVCVQHLIFLYTHGQPLSDCLSLSPSISLYTCLCISLSLTHTRTTPPPPLLCTHLTPILFSVLRSGSWCPKFISRRGARHRESLFRASSSTSSSSRLATGGRPNSTGSLKNSSSSSKHSSRVGGGRLGMGSRSISYVVQADEGGDANDNAERGSGVSGAPDLCEAEITGDNWWGSHEVGVLFLFLLWTVGF